jgi:fluoroacetyl-CoA thioesterase
MELTELFQTGMAREETFEVGPDNTASTVGSGGSKVLATPWMIAFMERAAHRLLMERLPAGMSSVGVHIDVRHMAPSPLGSQVRVRAEIASLEEMRVNFSVQAWDPIELVGQGTHQRVVIDETRFLSRVEKKLNALE